MADVVVDWDVIESVDDIVKVFKKAKARAEPEEEAALFQQEAETKTEFWRRQAQAAKLDSTRVSVLAKYPSLKGWEDEIRGSTPEELEASAKRINDRLEANAKEADNAKAAAAKAEADAKAQAAQQYGQPVGAGGGTPSRPPAEGWEANDQFIRGRLQRGEGLGDAKGKIAFGSWVGQRVAEAAEASRTNPSYRSFRPDTDRTISDDRRSAASRGYKPEKTR